MFLWGKNSWCLGIIILLLINIANARNISIEYNNIEKEEFNIKLRLIDYLEDDYDVKMDILAEGKRICKIENNGWKSTYYYINDIIKNNEEKTFNFRIDEDFKGEADLEVKIRDSKEKTSSYDYKININYEKSEEKAEESEEIEEEENEEELEEEEEENKIKEEDENNIEKIIITPKLEEIDDTKDNIKLTKDIKSRKSEENIKKYAIYFFIGFLLLAFVVFIIKNGKRNKDNNDF